MDSMLSVFIGRLSLVTTMVVNISVNCKFVKELIEGEYYFPYLPYQIEKAFKNFHSMLFYDKYYPVMTDKIDHPEG